MRNKRYSYSSARFLLILTGVIFFSQWLLELSGIATRKPGFELTVPICGAAFAASVIYTVILILLNARHNH